MKMKNKISIKYTIIFLVFLLSCNKDLSRLAEFQEDYYSKVVSGNFEYITEECAMFYSYCLFKFKSEDIHFYVLVNIDHTDSSNMRLQFKKNEIYYLVLKPIDEYPDLVPRIEGLGAYYIESELFWERGKIYPKCYKIIELKNSES